jgi:outer membrane protein assembly factor BamD
MMTLRLQTRRNFLLAASLAAALLAAAIPGCGPKQTPPQTGAGQADKYLFDNGTQALAKRQWLRAREYFRQIVDNYPQSAYRPDAKLGLGDTYVGENTLESLVLAINEFREFLTFYPTSARADYAQYKIGIAHFEQMLAPDRDQTETRAAVREFAAFLERYPGSTLADDAAAKLREARDRLSAADYRVGLYYFRSRWYPGCIARFVALLKENPQYTSRDAVYYYLAESYLALKRPAEARPYFDRLVKQFEKSEFLERAQQRLTELAAADEAAEKTDKPPVPEKAEKPPTW